jgi:hypothetical protein
MKKNGAVWMKKNGLCVDEEQWVVWMNNNGLCVDEEQRVVLCG